MTTSPFSRRTRLAGLAAAFGIAAAGVIGVGTASADGHLPVVYSGQGLDDDGNIEEVICDDPNSPYVLFVLTATRASEATIDIPDDPGDGVMYRQGRGGAWKYVYEAGADLTEPGVVEAFYDGRPTNAQLVIGHGCPGPDDPPS